MAREADERPATSRRDFLGAGLLGGALAAARPLLGGEPWAQGAAGSGAAGPGGEGEAGAAAGPAAQPPAPAAAAPETPPATGADGFELEEATIAGLQASMTA